MFVRDVDAAELEYALSVYLPGELRIDGALSWGPAGEVLLRLEGPAHWCHGEAQKLARVATRTKPQRLVRWRPEPNAG